MAIIKENTMFERILGAKCDSCGEDMPLDRVMGTLPEHMILKGHSQGMELEAVICKKCVDEKLSFINITKRRNSIGYC
jgi:hypothetical protein